MSVAAVSLASATASAAGGGAKGSRAAAFGSLLAGAGVGHDSAAPRDDDSTVRASADDEKQDRGDRKAESPEDPAALIALADCAAVVVRATPVPASDASAAKAANPITTLPPAAGASAAAPLAAEEAVAQEAPLVAAAQEALAAAILLPKNGKSVRMSTIDGAGAPAADVLAARAEKTLTSGAPDDGAKQDMPGGDGARVPAVDPAIAAAPSGVPPLTSADATPAGGDILATGATDRQLDLARGDAWLDGLARDIASTADAGGTLRFELSPPNLGSLQVAVTRGDEGVAVAMTTATADARAILADASPRLLDQARAHGVHISSATIAVSDTARAGTGGQQRDPSSDGGASSQARAAMASAGGGGDANGQAQSPPQSERDLYQGGRRQDATASAVTAASRRDLDAGYA